MLRHSPIPSPSPLLSSLRKSIHWKPRHESNLPRPELHDRISRLLILRRFDALEKLNFHFSDSLVDSILVKLKLNPEACLNFFQLATKQPNFTPDVKSYCKLVHILSRARMYDETRSYLNELACLCKNNYTSFLVFDELVRIYKDFKFSPLVFDMILKVYTEKGMVKNALHVFDNMGKYCRKPSLRSCNSLLSNLAKRGESYTAILVYDQMRRLDIVPDVFTRAIMVNAYCKAGKLERAAEFVKEMEKLGFELNVVSYNSLVDGYVSLGDVEGAKGVLKFMSERGVMRNKVTFTLLIKGYCKQCKVEEAEKVLREMEKEEGVVVDEYAYGALIDGYCKVGKMDDAIRVRDEMLKVGLKMNLFVCNSLINGYCKTGQVHEGERLLMRMRKWDLKPDSYSYCTLLDGYCRDGLSSKAFNVCDQMLRKGIEPTVVTYNTLLKGLCHVGGYKDALRLWHLMLQRGITPNEVGYCTLLDGLFKMGDFSRALILWDDILARGLLAEMYTKGLSPNVVTYGALIAGWCDQGRLDKAFGAYFEMIEKGFAPNVIICSKIVSSLYRCGRIDEANMLLQKMVDFDLVLDHRCMEDFQNDDIRKLDCRKIADTLDESDVEEAMRLLNEMKASNVDQTIATFSELVEDCIQHGDVKKMSKLHNMMHMACPSAGVTSHKQMGLSELSNAKEMLDAYTISEAAFCNPSVLYCFMVPNVACSDHLGQLTGGPLLIEETGKIVLSGSFNAAGWRQILPRLVNISVVLKETGNPPLMYYDVTDIFIMKSSGMDTMKVYFLSKVDGSKSAVNEASLCNKETPAVSSLCAMAYQKNSSMKFTLYLLKRRRYLYEISMLPCTEYDSSSSYTHKTSL
ncbi:hypothetical protein DKX38_020633 [Salix brachista]|uniref:Uncharacterized protein n=1 Tax=Salix brachista TaxID=2182728 RepID=A0A5N5K7G1_9ROSI|nr:hypothetical protein DKX38_020633 [Salix brachista]